MSGLQPLALYALRVPAGDMLAPAIPPQQVGTINVTMASIDPSEEIVGEDAEKPQRSTLKIIRLPFDLSDEDDEDYEDMSDDDDEDEDESGESDAEVNGGPSDLTKASKSKKQLLLEAAEGDSDEEMDDDDSDDEDPEEQAKAIKALEAAIRPDKGKAKALDDEDEDEDSDDDDLSDDDNAMEEEIVVCTLDTNQHYQQPLNITVAKHEMVFFQVTGTHTVHLTGNYVAPIDPLAGYDPDEEDEEYDLSPDEEEVDGLDELIAPGSESESDELDDIINPPKAEVFQQAGEGQQKRKRVIGEVEDEEEPVAKKPTTVQLTKQEAAEPILPVTLPAEPVVNGETKKLSKAERKKLKKQKLKNDEPAPPTSETVTNASAKKDALPTTGTTNGAEKKVQFAKNLVEGPSSSAASNKPDTSKKPLGNAITTTNIQGMKVEVRDLGSGPQARKGSKIEMRYIGKLSDGKVFDSNKSGKPFSLTLGQGEVIKGWDLGLEGIQAGGTRRLVIPAKLAYGNKQLPGIPKGSELTFDVKCLSVS